MLIVLEGCDCTGKSTLAHLIAERIGAEYRHYGPPERHPFLEYEGDLYDYRPGTGQNIVVDRLHWGEIVYGKIYRGESKLGSVGLDHINLFLRARGAVMVCVSAQEEVVISRMQSRGEDYLKPEHVPEVLMGMHDCAHRTAQTMPTFWYDTTPTVGFSMEGVELMIGTAQHFEAQASSLLEAPNYIGKPTPRWLLLGEKKGPGAPAELADLDVPFLPLAHTSGAYLMRAVDPWIGEIGIANALEVDVPRLWHTLGCPEIITLGRIAERVVETAGIPNRQVPHPQFWRRFHHRRLAEYRGLLFQ